METSRFAIPRSPALRRQAATALACLALLAGCQSATTSVESFYDSKLSPDRPIDWWHQLQGGPIANVRPPPPGAGDPYPNFAAIPARPTPIDPATRRNLLTRMTAERDRAQRRTAQDPVVFPTPPTPATLKPTPATTTPTAAPTPTPADTSTLTFDAADAPAAPRFAPTVAPTARTDPNPPAAMQRPAQVASGPIPVVPTDAPALPNLPGLPALATASESAPPAQTGSGFGGSRPAPAARFGFAPGSSQLSPAADAALRTLAARTGGAPVAIRAGGDARSAAPDAQRAALPLALRRTGAIAAVLIAAGVPAAAIRSEATAQGRDASALLVN